MTAFEAFEAEIGPEEAMTVLSFAVEHELLDAA